MGQAQLITAPSSSCCSQPESWNLEKNLQEEAGRGTGLVVRIGLVGPSLFSPSSRAANEESIYVHRSFLPIAAAGAGLLYTARLILLGPLGQHGAWLGAGQTSGTSLLPRQGMFAPVLRKGQRKNQFVKKLLMSH